MIVVSLLLILVAVVLLALGLASGANTLLFGSIAASMLAAVMLYVGARQVAADQPSVTTRRSPRAGQRPRAGDEAPAEPASRRPTPAFVPVVREPAELAEVRELVEPRELVSREPVSREPAELREPVGPSAAMARLLREPGPQPATTASTAPSGPSGAWSQAPGKATEAARPAPATAATAAAGAAAEDGGDEDGEDYEDEDPPDEPAAQEVSAPVATRLARLSAEVLVVDGRPRYHLAGCDHLQGRESEPLPVSEAVELGFTPCSRCEPVRALLAYTQPG